jgi:hypothetical protein
VSGPRDEFLSEEDLDLRNLSDDELVATWNLWLEQAQATNDLDAHLYSHGVFEREPENATRSGDRAIDVRTGRVPQTGGGKGNGVSGA